MAVALVLALIARNDAGMPEEIVIADRLFHILAVALLPLAWLAKLSWPSLKRCHRDILERGFRKAWLGCMVPVLRIFLMAGLIYSAAYTFVTRRPLFVAISIGDNLVLDYPWPRPDVTLPWDTVQEAKIEEVYRTRRGAKRTYFRLLVITQTRQHLTPSILDDVAVRRGREIIQARLGKDK